MQNPEKKDRVPHMALALDILEETCTLAGFGDSREECVSKRDRIDSPYFRIFALTDRDLDKNMLDWFRSCGLQEEDANRLVRLTSKTLLDLLEPTEAAHANGGKQ